MTEKLYYVDSYAKEFSATVIGCKKSAGEYEGKYEIILDKTAFFPQGGGQSADRGSIGEVQVLDVQMNKDGTILHYTDGELECGKQYCCMLDFEERFRKMQNHSGEHIVSGLVHSLYGYDNVGFHLGSEDVTMDYNGVLTREDILKIEYLANRACAKNIDIIARYPDSEELSKMQYRSKIELLDDVRIVEIPGYDVCACCAPHVEKTGAIGMIKLLDFIKYKGGVRIHMKCGFDALDDYNDKYRNVSKIAERLSAKQSEASLAVQRLEEELSGKKQEYAELMKKYISAKVEALPQSSGNLLYFEEGLDADAQRMAANIGKAKCEGVFTVCSGDDESGYRYIMASRSVKLRAFVKDNIKLPGGGGGSDEMMQGMFKCTRADIEKALGCKML